MEQTYGGNNPTVRSNQAQCMHAHCAFCAEHFAHINVGQRKLEHKSSAMFLQHKNRENTTVGHHTSKNK